MGSWLYPLSSRAGYVFLIGRREIDVSPGSFRELVLNKQINKDRRWWVHKNFRRAQPHDDVYVYFGSSDGDLGIVGVGKLLRVEPPRRNEGKWHFKIQIDVGKSRQLLDRPVPAKAVRRWVPWPRFPVMNLDKFERELRKMLPY